MTRLFNAYFRAADEQKLIGSILHLDLPNSNDNRYHFHAKFTRKAGWVVETELKQEHRKVRFESTFVKAPIKAARH